MKKSKLIQIIKEEQKYIKNLVEEKRKIEGLLKEKAEIEERLTEIDAAINPQDGAADCDETTAIGLGKNIEHSAGHEEELDETMSTAMNAVGQRGAARRQDTMEKIGIRDESKKEINEVRNIVKNQLFELCGFKNNKFKYGEKDDAYIITLKHDARCSETGKLIQRGERALFNPFDKKIYHLTAPQAQDYIQNKPKLVNEIKQFVKKHLLKLNEEVSETPKQISEEEAEQVFNNGNFIYIKTDEGNLESTRNLLLLSNKIWDGSMNIYKANQTPEEYGFQNILSWIRERTPYKLEFYTLYSKTPTMIGN